MFSFSARRLGLSVAGGGSALEGKDTVAILLSPKFQTPPMGVCVLRLGTLLGVSLKGMPGKPPFLSRHISERGCHMLVQVIPNVRRLRDSTVSSLPGFSLIFHRNAGRQPLWNLPFPSGYFWTGTRKFIGPGAGTQNARPRGLTDTPGPSSISEPLGNARPKGQSEKSTRSPHKINRSNKQ